MRDVLRLGGDTDTNAAIVGAMIGARDGVERLSERMVATVMKCDTALGRARPSRYHPAAFEDFLCELVYNES
jgi:ADP-ribosylglycohydrolase